MFSDNDSDVDVHGARGIHPLGHRFPQRLHLLFNSVGGPFRAKIAG